MQRKFTIVLPALIAAVACLPALAATANLANKTGKSITLDVPAGNKAQWKKKGAKSLAVLNPDRSSIVMADKDEIVLDVTSRAAGGDIWFSLTDPSGKELKFHYPRLKNKWVAMDDNPTSSMTVQIGSGDKLTLTLAK